MPTQPKQILDGEAARFAAIAGELKVEYLERGAMWAGSPFEWILMRPSRQRGKIGEQLVAEWCGAHGLNVSRSPDSDADRIIEGRRVEIKFSTLWEKGSYTFQQIRDQDYEYLLCLGISPFSVHAWLVKKSEIPFSTLKQQHGGVRGRDTWWLTITPEAPPEWLRPHGGSLTKVLRLLAALRR